MLTIYNGRKHFWQWDSGQRLVVEDGAICEVHFHNPGGEVALTVKTYEMNGSHVADVPNILLQKSGQINAWVYICVGDDCTIQERSFEVWPRQRPADYVYIETQAFDSKVDKYQGTENAGKILGIGEDGYVKPLPAAAGGGTGFEPDETLILKDGILSVNTADAVEKDNTLPVTSGAVYAEVGNINALLETI